MGYKIKIEKIHDIINNFTIFLFKIPYLDYLDSYKTLSFLDDIDLKMYKKNEIFKYKNINEPEFIYNQFTCETASKKIILKTKFNKFENFNSLTDFIATSSTSIKNLLDYMNKNFIDEIKVKCIITLRDFEAKLNSNEDENKYKLCLRAYDDGLINKYGSIFKVLKLTNEKILFENIMGSPIYKILYNNNNTNIKNNNISNNDKIFKETRLDPNNFENIEHNKFKIYHTEQSNLKDQEKKFIKNYTNRRNLINPNNDLSYWNNQNNFYSFIEVNSSSKFYSNDLLIKLENGMNHITEKIIESSKKISEFSKYYYVK